MNSKKEQKIISCKMYKFETFLNFIWYTEKKKRIICF
jgi:hypothetical protein